jgi:hypothetical protein
METVLEWLQEVFSGQYQILAWFILSIIILYVPGLFLYLLIRKKRGENYLRKHPQAAIVRISRSGLTGILTVHEVDGKKPLLVSQGIDLCFFLTPGKHTLLLSYQWTEVSLPGKLIPRFFYANTMVSGRNSKERVFVEPHGKYCLHYDRDTEEYVFSKDRANVNHDQTQKAM